MSTSRKVKVALFLWLGVEVFCAILLVRAVGWPAAILLGLLTTGLGFALMARAGQEALGAVSNMSSEPSTFFSQIGAFSKLAAALLLVIPGFASDLLGLLLLFHPARSFLARRFGVHRQSSAGTTLDLPPDQWRAGE